MNGEKKSKSLRGRNKSSEGRKQLASVRVIQRNLVYVVGLPLNLADEDVGTFSYLFSFIYSLTSISSPINIQFFLAASSVQGIFCSVWKGVEGIYLPDSYWCYTKFRK